MNNTPIKSIETDECLDISEKDTIISNTKNRIKESLNENFLARMISDLKKREKDGTIYKYIGVKEFRKLIGITVELAAKKTISKNGRKLKHYSILSYDKEGLEKEIVLGRKAEVVHGIATIVCLVGVVSVMMTTGNLDYISLLFFLQQFYCVILQRYNRGRIINVLEKKNHRLNNQ